MRFILNRLVLSACFSGVSLISVALMVPVAIAQGWQDDWNRTVIAARKEGKLSLYIKSYDGVLKEFNKNYPEIKTTIVTGDGPVLGQRIVSERRAEKFLADVYVGGPYTVGSMLIPTNAVDTLPDKLILPEVLDTGAWVNGVLRYTDATRKFNFAFLASPGSDQLSYNTNLVKPGEITSYVDVVDPRWKSKIVSMDPTQRHIGATLQFMYYNPNLGPDYLNKLFSDMDIVYSRNTRQMTDWLAAGRFAVCIGCLDPTIAKAQGLPVELFDAKTEMREGSSFQTGSGSISILNNAPNPNAAKLFVNWLLSREGQIAIQKLDDGGTHVNSARIDIPKDDVDAQNQLHPGRKYFDQNNPDWADMTQVDSLAKTIMAKKSLQ